MKKFGRLAALASMLLTVALILSACGGDNSTATPAPSAATATTGSVASSAGSSTPAPSGNVVTVQEKDFLFSPSSITINVGDTVMFVNSGAAAHTATANDGSWDSGTMDVGANFSHTFTAVGTVGYYCKYHGNVSGKGMVGTITVVASGATNPSATTPTAATAASTGGQAATVTVNVQDYQFAPKTISIKVGDTIMFVNKGAVAHTVTASDSSWDSGNLDANATYTHTFTTAGTVPYYCKYHGSANGSGMAGTITVTAAGAGSTGSTGAAGTTPTAASQTAAASPTTVAASGGQGGAVTVALQDYKFVPQNMTVNVGGSINFVNKGAVAHTATAGDGSWDSGNLDSGQSFSHTFNTAGTFVVYCRYHGSADGKGMAGTITVVQGSGSGSTSAASPTAMSAMTSTAGMSMTSTTMTPTVGMGMTSTMVMTGGFMTGAPDSVVAADQPAGSTVLVKHVHANMNGWITVHANTADNKPGAQLGHTAVKEGDNDNVVVQVSPATKPGDKLWPMLHIDAGVIGTYEFPGPDAPVIINGNIVMQQITITAASAVMPSVTVSDQPAGSSITVTKVIATQDGWITVHANTSDNKPGDQLGHTQVKAGENDNVVVQLNPAPKPGDKVWPMLHIDAGVIGTYEFPGPDAPVIVNGNIVMQQITMTAAPQIVQLLDNHFSSTDITINVGDAIMFVNNGVRAHTATAGNGSWDSGNLDPGASFSHTFNTPGVFIVYCKYHGSADGKGMATAITVVSGTPSP